ncbi:TetR/AcrR family transcriptional regulator [Shewanella sp. SG41-4]|uniref:TetR/AcrR family transcriptional regulator n=1 Tax=Shewanella sp. SG41-4 TaxID=2760976 RepID=UPI0016035653|nr:TetR/AcrR family transcriptional regulator [Shewanella sp. SG41-4]MBB1441437.1 TetR/AcrR family transcriptional regulator [Shewanella sp. SG41-4]
MSKKKAHLVESALEVFYQNGINATGINAVLEEAKISKRTLYCHFRSKDELILATINLRHERFMQWLVSLIQYDESPQQAITSIFVGLDDWFNNRTTTIGPFRGCYFINTSVESEPLDEAIAMACKSHKDDVYELLLNIVKPISRTAQQAENLAEQLLLLKEGAIISALVRHKKDAIKYILPLIEQLLIVD